MSENKNNCNLKYNITTYCNLEKIKFNLNNFKFYG